MRLIFRIFLLLVAGLTAGFGWFLVALPDVHSFREEEALAKLSDFSAKEVGIVALTGADGTRIERALTLFEAGSADRVLISGTHPDVRLEDLAITGDRTVLACCVDLGTEAQTTWGNGTEARDWAEANGYRAILLVTSHYHMPRARLELKDAAPDLKVVGIPVSAPPVEEGQWHKNYRGWRQMTGEYIKYLLTSVRTLF